MKKSEIKSGKNYIIIFPNFDDINNDIIDEEIFLGISESYDIMEKEIYNSNDLLLLFSELESDRYGNVILNSLIINEVLDTDLEVLKRLGFISKD